MPAAFSAAHTHKAVTNMIKGSVPVNNIWKSECTLQVNSLAENAGDVQWIRLAAALSIWRWRRVISLTGWMGFSRGCILQHRSR